MKIILKALLPTVNIESTLPHSRDTPALQNFLNSCFSWWGKGGPTRNLHLEFLGLSPGWQHASVLPAVLLFRPQFWSFLIDFTVLTWVSELWPKEIIWASGCAQRQQCPWWWWHVLKADFGKEWESGVPYDVSDSFLKNMPAVKLGFVRHQAKNSHWTRSHWSL